LLTLYAWPRSFADPHIATIQWNAIQSWLRLEPRPAVILFGNEEGVAETCSKLGLIHLPLPRSAAPESTPLSHLATQAERVNRTLFYGFTNSDILLTNSLMNALPVIRAKTPRFLLGVRPWDVNVTKRLDFGPGWEAELDRLVEAGNHLRERHSADLFVYPRGFLQSAPEVVAGRYYVDNALMWWTRRQKAWLIDGTPGILTCHQNHPYSHLGELRFSQHETPGAHWNLQCVGGKMHLFTLANATHHYTGESLRRYVVGTLCRWSPHPQASRSLYLLTRALEISTHPFRRALGMATPLTTLNSRSR
jgi:hypothetical protein